MGDLEIVTSSLSISETDKKAVLKLAVDLDKCWNEHNPKAYAMLFTFDGDFRFHDGIWISGRKAIEEFWRDQVFSKLPPGFRHEVTLTRARFITENTAIGDGIIRIVETIEGQGYIHLNAEVTAIVVKNGDRWYISAARLAVLSPT